MKYRGSAGEEESSVADGSIVVELFIEFAFEGSTKKTAQERHQP